MVVTVKQISDNNQRPADLQQFLLCTFINHRCKAKIKACVYETVMVKIQPANHWTIT